jgi:hypothetical protein
MATELGRFASELTPERTILFFGAGASLASHAPTVEKLKQHFENVFEVPSDGYSLREYAGILENQYTRKRLIEELRQPFKGLRPTGSLLNLPHYSWKSLFTTNFDTLIEQSFAQQHIDLSVYESNYDFRVHDQPASMKLFKLHGSIDKDISDGHSSRIILTDADYDHTQTFREGLYDRFKADLYGADLVVIGHSLADEDIKSIANRAAEISTKTGGVGRITLLMYQQDANRASLWEKRGFQVCFGGLDEFFSAISKKLPYSTMVYQDAEKPLDHAPALRPITIDISHAISGSSDVSSMFNGWPATYADIQSGLTFNRNVSVAIENYLEKDDPVCAVILGASGLGKTTAARQTMLRLMAKGYYCWEHKGDFELPARDWANIARAMPNFNAKGVLLIDEAHSHLHQVNALLDKLHAEQIHHLKLVLVSTRNHWNPRIKSPAFYKIAQEFHVKKLEPSEVDGLLNLIDANPEIRSLVEESFSGFSRYEKRRRLVDRCESETFVCLKNIFSTEKFDDIILREYASLSSEHQEIYRLVAAMESSGIRVHRQLVIRLLGIQAAEVKAALTHLTDIIQEYTISEREGIYGWRGRHNVIVTILTKYKFPEISMFIELFEKVIDSISPTFDIEIRTIRELCNIESGLPRISDKSAQNRLLRKMMSIAPGERVPRHRLIRNLIEVGDFEKADAEIRIFEKDFGRDAPVTRYRVNILIERALRSPGILAEDRLAILYQARDLAVAAITKFPDNRFILRAYCEVGIKIFRMTNDFAVFDAAMKELKATEVKIGDPDISRLIGNLERQMSGQPVESGPPLEEVESLIDDAE